jgi:hypothetical protein
LKGQLLGIANDLEREEARMTPWFPSHQLQEGYKLGKFGERRSRKIMKIYLKELNNRSH